MEAVLWFFLLLAISVITYIARRHAQLFHNRIAYPLLGLSILSVLFMSIYNIGGLGIHVNSLIEEVSKSEAKAAVVKFYAQHVNARYELQVNSLWFGGTIAAYLALLIFLPRIVRPAKRKWNARSS